VGLNESLNPKKISILGRRGDMRNDGFLITLRCLISFAFNLGLTQLNLTPEISYLVFLPISFINIRHSSSINNKREFPNISLNNLVKGKLYVYHTDK
jgi:hypothetical protein